MTTYERVIRRGRWLVAHRGWLPVAGLAAPLGALLLTTPFRLIGSNWWLTTAAVLLAVAGVVLHAAAGAVALDRRTKGLPGPATLPDYVAAGGIYSVMRFPTYGANTLLVLAVAVYTGAVWYMVLCAVVCFTTGYCAAMAQEHSLATRYGDEFAVWCRSTFAFTPLVFNWQPWNIRVSPLKALLAQSRMMAFTAACFLLTDLLKGWVIDLEFRPSVPWLIATGAAFVLALLFPAKRAKKVHKDQ